MDLPFESAILTVATSDYKTCWLNNIPEVAEKLPAGHGVYKNIREHQLDLELVSSLMCSTAIPLRIFPEQELYYKDGSEHQAITRRFHNPAKFKDGGTRGVFKRFKEFFETYGENFDNIYFISPDFPKNETEAYKLIEAEDLESEQNTMELSMELSLNFNDSTNKFIHELKKYNVDGRLANKIYYCKPQIDYYDKHITPPEPYKPLIFDQEKDLYSDTISWGKNNTSDIAIDINDIDTLE